MNKPYRSRSFAIDEETYARAKFIANRSGMSMSAFVRLLMRNATDDVLDTMSL